MSGRCSVIPFRARRQGRRAPIAAEVPSGRCTGPRVSDELTVERAGSALRALACASVRVSWRRDRASWARAPRVRGPGEPGCVDPVHRPGRALPPGALRSAAARRELPRLRRRCGGDACAGGHLALGGRCSGARGHRCRGAPCACRGPHRADRRAPASHPGLSCDGPGREIDPDASGEESSSTRREICPP